MFNAPDEAIDALHEVGFNLVNFCSNHVYDQGEAGVLRTHELFEQYRDQMMVLGSFTSQEERDATHMIECNGMRFAFLSYTYGCNFNGSDPANFPNDYMLCGFDTEVMEREIRQAQGLADAVIVVMHWGSEYVYEPNDQQWDYAQFLADLDVDLVLGTHAHVMQPARIVTGANGNVEVSNLLWTPTVEWSDGGDVYVRFLKDMSPAEVNSSTCVDDVPGGDYYQHYVDLTEACNMDIPVAL